MEVRKQQCAKVVISVSIVAAIVGWLLSRFYSSRTQSTDEESKSTASVSSEKPVPTPAQSEEKSEVAQPQTTATYHATDDYVLNLDQAKAVLFLLRSEQDEWVENALVTITRTAAFTQNQQTWRNAGSLPVMTALVSERTENCIKEPSPDKERFLVSLLHTVTNLAANEQNQTEMRDMLPHLMTLCTTNGVSENVQLMALQALTNFALLNDSHAPYTRIIQQLYQMIDTGSFAVQVQVLKILVNLSCNDDMIPYLLAAKASTTLPSFLEPATVEDLLLRTVVFLSHVVSAVHRLHITATSLPSYYKAASPDTMYAALFGVSSVGRLRSRMFVLTHHSHADIKRMAAAAYVQLPSH